MNFIINNKNSKMQVEQNGDIIYLTFPAFSNTGLVNHLFSTRLGGISEGFFTSMNLSYTRGDKKEAVDENFDRIAKVLSCDSSDFVCSDQTHTTNIRIVTGKDRGKGVRRPKDYRDIDGLLTDEEGIALATFYADCVPLYFMDVRKRVIGLAHSGWRGTAGRIGEKMISLMQEQYGCEKKDILAAIGPSICVDCYEVSEDVAIVFKNEFGDTVLRDGRETGKFQLDLWKANEIILLESGLNSSQISIANICTCCNDKILYSHRASQGKRGNLGAFIMLKNTTLEEING